VTDSNSEPLQSVYVSAHSSAGNYYGWTLTDSLGNYGIAPLGAATDYTVKALLPGYEDEENTSVSVIQNQETTGIDFVLTQE